ncbi:hypothetical protein [Amycolatopsis magusensis]|uniref:hypothetical protein n=1 Tax=Amycolatopsis magusensis TaxID=882444 RepID=UPI0037B07642
MLHTQLAETAEEKLLEALHITTEMVPTQIEQVVHGRLPLDEEHQLAEKLITAAKSVNHHLKNGDLTADTIPDTTAAKIDDAKAALAAVESAIGEPGQTEATMLGHYKQQLQAIAHSVGTATKVGQVAPYLHQGTTTVTTMMPALVADGDDHVAAVLRKATRIKPDLDETTGQAHWDGNARWDHVSGKEYAINLGDGFQAIYRPYSINDPAHTEYSLRGRLEIIAPPGDGHGHDLVNRLGQLNLANRPMTRDEGEHTYLAANIKAQDLGTQAEVAEAISTGDQLEEMIRQELFQARAHQAVGMDSAQLGRFAKSIQLEAHTKALPPRVKVLRNAVATATGHASGEALAATDGYDPTPRRSGGWLTWTRFDVGNSMPSLQKALTGKALVHATSFDGLKAMLASGSLASTERRTMMGVKAGVGKSEGQDKYTGGASSVFLRVMATPSDKIHASLVWDDPATLLSRADYYGANADTFGAVNPAKAAHSKATRNPFKIAKFANPANEVMFGDGIDLLGPGGPSRIMCGSKSARNTLHALLTAKGVTEIAGKPLDDVLKS